MSNSQETYTYRAGLEAVDVGKLNRWGLKISR